MPAGGDRSADPALELLERALDMLARGLARDNDDRSPRALLEEAAARGSTAAMLELAERTLLPSPPPAAALEADAGGGETAPLDDPLAGWMGGAGAGVGAAAGLEEEAAAQGRLDSRQEALAMAIHAALLGDAEAAALLGTLLASGQASGSDALHPPDEVAALAWFRRAREGGDLQASTLRSLRCSAPRGSRRRCRPRWRWRTGTGKAWGVWRRTAVPPRTSMYVRHAAAAVRSRAAAHSTVCAAGGGAGVAAYERGGGG